MEATSTGRANGGAERLVIVRTDDGFRVYSPANPARSYTVSGGLEHPTCTCPEFQQSPAGEYC